MMDLKQLRGTNVPSEIPTASADDSEGVIREYVKSQLPRLIKRTSKPLLIEEMEVCSGRARVDIAVIAEHLIGIEIKGPKDDVTRLPGQAKAYSQCFDRVVLVIHESLMSKAKPLIPQWWGIVVGRQQDARWEYQLERRPKANPELDVNAMLSLLWRHEILDILFNCSGSVPKAGASKKTIRAELISRVDASVLRCASLKKLRERTDWRAVPVHA
jgi:hypothetical protein